MKLLLDITSIQQNFDLQTKTTTSFLVSRTLAGDVHVPIPEELVSLVIGAAGTDEVLDLSREDLPAAEEPALPEKEPDTERDADEEASVARNVRMIISDYEEGRGISDSRIGYLTDVGIDFHGLVAKGRIREPALPAPEPEPEEEEPEEREFSVEPPAAVAHSMGSLEGDEGRPSGPVNSVIEGLKAKARVKPGKPKAVAVAAKVPEAGDDLFPQG